MLIMKFNCVVGNSLIVLIAQLVYLIDCVHLFKKAFFHLFNLNFYTVWGENSLIGQVLLLRVEYLDKSVSLIISLAWSEDHIEVEL